MTDNDLKEYQALANKAFALFMLKPNTENHKIATDAAMNYKAAILVNKRMSSGDNSAAYIDSLFGEGNE